MASKIIFFLFILSASLTAQQLPEGYELTSAGKFQIISSYDRTSPDRQYSCTFKIAAAGDEVRELADFVFYHNNIVSYKLSSVPGSDLYISNSGIAAFIDHKLHFNNQIRIHFFSPEGKEISSIDFRGAYAFNFSPDGDIIGIAAPGKLTLFFIKENRKSEYPGCMSFDIGEKGNFVVTADENKISVYSGNNLLYNLPIEEYVRKIRITDGSDFCYTTRSRFSIHSISENLQKYSSSLEEGYTFNDLLLSEGRVLLGVNKRENSRLTGYLTEYSNGKITALKKSIEKDYSKPPVLMKERGNSSYDPIPWPFFPFDSARTAWNHYEQHMGYGTTDYSYLHQGFDIITPIEEPTYTVQQGVVKCVLTLGGAIYWRVAVSPVQTSGRSSGWLYAHLIESSIPVFTGDTVDIHEYIGDIIEWTDEWGHIHFVQINDSGTVWLYDDDQWGINFNPLLAIQPLTDTIPPAIISSSSRPKYEFCKNETSVYLNANNLSGEIDIIIRAIDYIGDSEWQQPAFKSEYWIRSLASDSIVYPRRTGHILNHSYNTFSSASFEPYARVLYKRDSYHPAPYWMDTERDFFHIITHNADSSSMDSTHRNRAFDTRNFFDGLYRLYVEVFDPSDNSSIDSIDIKFVNGIVSVSDEFILLSNDLLQNYPNPFNPSTTIGFQLSGSSRAAIKLYDLLGKEVAVLLDEFRNAGYHQIIFNSEDYNLPSGLYFYRFTTGDFSSVKKLLLLK